MGCLPLLAGAGGRRWRLAGAAVVALCLFPVAVPLVLLWLPLLCVAVPAVRFRRRRRRRGCAAAERSPPDMDAGDRLALLQKYLEDQLELVGADDAGDDCE